ncbi:MAG: AEC family transporter [Clostridia bacterium]|nr:AEC family transporter [Clostridia bacterium]
MLSVFLFAANAVLPIVAVILLGFVLRKSGFLGEKFFADANRLMFKVALPAMLFYNIYNIESIADIQVSTLVFGVAAVTVLFLLGLLFSVLFVKDPKQKGVVWQATFRSNSALIGYQLAETLGGAAGLQCISLLSAFTIAQFNVFAVIALSVFSTNGHPDWKKVIKGIVKNPLIIAIFCGLAVLVIRSFIPENADGEKVFMLQTAFPFLYTALKQVAGIASPIAFLVLGGQFSFKAIKGMFGQIVSGTLLRVVAAPVLILGAAVLLSKYTNLFSFQAAEYAAFVALFGSPVAVSSAVMAKEMNNDEQLAGQLVVWSSLLSIFTIFITVCVLRYAGLL